MQKNSRVLYLILLFGMFSGCAPVSIDESDQDQESEALMVVATQQGELAEESGSGSGVEELESSLNEEGLEGQAPYGELESIFPTRDLSLHESVTLRETVEDDESLLETTSQRDDFSRVNSIEQGSLAELLTPISSQTETQRQSIETLCEDVGNKLGSVSVDDCKFQQLQFGGAYSNHDRPLSARDFLPSNESQARARVLILGGIHGDEYSSISIMFKWMGALIADRKDEYYWRFLPLVNPDGLLDSKAVRQNANGVDLNRNFPTQDWESLAQRNWIDKTGSNPRRYPGERAASEPEVRWVVDQIESFKPDVIVSVHAPYHLLDFDGPVAAPDKIGELYLHQLGVYPGSLGNYGGLQLGIPVVTLELPSAGIMPTEEQIETMWGDLMEWLDSQSFLGNESEN